MIGLFIKKNFFEGWENIGNIIVSNLLTIPFIGLIFLGFLLNGSINLFNGVGSMVLFQAASVFFGTPILVVLAAGYCKNAVAIANHESGKCGEYFKNLGWALKNTLGFGFLCGFILTACSVGIPFYVQVDPFYGPLIAGFLMFFSAIVLLAFQWFIPLKALLGFKFKKTLSKCFDVLFDNFAFSLFMALYTFVLFACSTILLFFMPGFAGMVLAHVNALKLRLYKYDWLDQHKDKKGIKDRKNIPWEALLKEEEDFIGKKSIKSLFLPWKSEKED